jgi:hypothetical protein
VLAEVVIRVKIPELRAVAFTEDGGMTSDTVVVMTLTGALLVLTFVETAGTELEAVSVKMPLPAVDDIVSE